MSSEPYTLEHFLQAAGVPAPASFSSQLKMAFTPRADQVVGLNRMLVNDRFGLFDDPGCVSADTEFLHPTGWKRIDQWRGEQVAQFDPDTGEATFTLPLRYVKMPCDEMFHLQAGRGIDQMLSSEHRVLTYSVTNRKRDGRIGPMQVCSAQAMFDTQHKNTGRKIRTAFGLPDRAPVDILDAELRLMVAVIADGHLPNQNSTCHMRLKKQRKINRLRTLLDSLGCSYRDVECKPEGFRLFTFTAPRREKEFTDWWWGLNPRQLAVVVDEARHWDGSEDARGNGCYSFYSRVERSADFIQYAASATGRTANKYRYTRADGKVDFVVRVQTGTAYVSGKPNRTWIVKVPNPEGFKYCFQVPTGFLVMRRNGKVFITGNCGKTVQIQAKNLQTVADGNKVLLLMPPVLLGQYVESLCETFTEPERFVSWHVLNQGPAAREALFAEWRASDWPDLLLMSYEMFVLLSRVPKGQKTGRPAIAHEIRELYRIVDCDEGHKLCGHDTYLHDSLAWHLGEPGEGLLTIATGTPMPNTPLNAYGLIELLNPEAYANFGMFERRHAIYKKIRFAEPRMRGTKLVEWQVVLDGFKGQEKIREHLYRYGRRVIKEQVLSLHEPTIREVPVVLGADHMALYKKLEKKRILEFQGQIIAGGINDQRLRQALLRIVTNPEAFIAPGKTIYNAVLDTLLSLLDSHGNAAPTEDGFPNKVIIFCNLRATAAWLRTALAEFNPVVLNGDTPDKETVRRAFQEDPKVRLLIANPQSAGFGLNFQHVCRTVVFAEPTSVPGEFKQAMERIYRSGQAGVCYAYILRASGTIAPRATKEMLNRMSEINLVNRDSVILSTYLKRRA